MCNIHSECYLLHFKISYSDKHRRCEKKKKKGGLTFRKTARNARRYFPSNSPNFHLSEPPLSRVSAGDTSLINVVQ